MENWLRPLHSKVPGRTRIARERILRRVAVILCLARTGLSFRAGSEPARAINTDKAELVSCHVDLPTPQIGGFDATMTNGNGGINGALSSPPPATQSSQLSVDAGFLGMERLEDNERSAQASYAVPVLSSTLHLATGTTMSNSGNEDLACARLRQYTTVDFQPRLPPSMSKILSHWTQGSDPVHYDWSIATASAITPKDVEGAANRIRQKSTPRRRVSQKGQGGPVTSAFQTVPDRLWGSQPPLLQSVPKSSHLIEEFAPMSQVERGLHGGRQGPPSKQRRRPGKVRLAGF